MITPNIVTVYNSPNCGSFLQAYALGDVLFNLTGVSPRYVDTASRSTRESFAKVMVRSILSHDLRRIGYEKKRADNFEAALSDFKVISQETEFSDSDLLVFGSDEIWNLARPDMSHYPAFWGGGLHGGVRVSYAPATNGANLSSLDCLDDFCSNLENFDLISVRDPKSQSSVQAVIDREVQVVCDPTLLLDINVYRSIQEPSKLDKFILVYSYGRDMSREDITGIRDFADEQGLKLVSAGYFLPWCDVNIPPGPFEFLGLMDKAEYVVTDTFHGTVFSSIYHKRFVSFARTNSKVVEFLHGYSLNDHIVNDVSSMRERLLVESDFSSFDACCAEVRERSLAYLQRAVDLCSKKSEEGLSSQSIKVERGVPLASLTTFKMGGKAARLWEPRCGDDLSALPKGKNGYRVLSAGSNLLISERTFTDVISMRRYDDSIKGLGGGEYRVGASARVQHFISKVNADGYGGIEALVSIPAMVGGLICMNASVPSAKTCISDYLISVEVFDGEKVVEIPKAKCGFGYRTSVFQDCRALILGANFRFPEQGLAASTAKVDSRKKYVKGTQDKSAPSFGSVFCQSRGKAMEFIRKKGLSVGGVAFSRKSANWMLNNGGTFDDAIALIGEAKRINKFFGKKVKLEVRVWR